MGNLASTYSNQGRWKEAEELEAQAMEMHSRNDADATAIFQQIRQGVDIESILRYVHTGDILLHEASP